MGKEEVLDEQLDEYIVNTEKEMKAYKKLASGFRALVLLQGNKGEPPYVSQFRLYMGFSRECNEILKILKTIKKNRMVKNG
jgi:hypothetical protein